MSGHILFKKKFFFIITIISLLFVLCFLIFEVYIRVTYDQEDLFVLTGRIPGENPMIEWAYLDAYCGYRYKPGIFSEGKTINKHGFISTPEIDVVKPEGTIRIVFLGGSSTAGTGRELRDEETWPWQTVEGIRTMTDVPVDFINGAVGGFTSFESYGRLWSRIRHFSPDVVILYHAWNEMYYFHRVNDIERWKTLPDGSWTLDWIPDPIVRFKPIWIDPVIRWSHGLSRIRLKLSNPYSGELGPDRSEELKTDFDHRALDIWRTNLKIIRSTCEVLGIRLVVVKQPTLIVQDLPVEFRERCDYARHYFDHNAHVKAFQAIYDVIDQEIHKKSILDLTSISGQPELFYDHVHPTPEGCLEIARHISKFLVNAIIPEVEALSNTKM